MTDAQLIAIGAAFLAAIVAVLFNNSRISDLRSSMDKRFDDINRYIDDKHALLDSKLDHIIEMLASHHDRLVRLENK